MISRRGIAIAFLWRHSECPGRPADHVPNLQIESAADEMGQCPLEVC